MVRLTSSEIEKALLSGNSLSYSDASGKPVTLQLSEAKQRQLFEFVLRSTVRSPTELPQGFIAGLQNAFDASHDPAIGATNSATTSPQSAGPWKLSTIESEGFGGLNTWQGQTFSFDFGGDSFIFEGPNGSGKSSLITAVLWALTGQRLRDQSDVAEIEKRPVYGNGSRPAGHWPPLACYPPTIVGTASAPVVRVKVKFVDPTGQTATVERTLSAGTISANISQNFEVPQVLIETGLLMPARLARIRVNNSGNGLKGAVQQLTGLDDLIDIGVLTAGLCHASREYRSYRARELATLVSNFSNAIEIARNALAPVDMTVADFKPSDTEDQNGPMVAFGRVLSENTAAQANVVKNDLRSGLQLNQTRVQNEIVTHIAAAREDIDRGLANSPTWQILSSIEAALDAQAATGLANGIAVARSKLEEARDLFHKSKLDSRFQIKAIGARWHNQHAIGSIKDCPLCALPITDLLLGTELETLRGAGVAATRAFTDNVNAITLEFSRSIPDQLSAFDLKLLALEPRRQLIEEITATFINQSRYHDCLIKISRAVEDSISLVPDNELPAIAPPHALPDEDEAKRLVERIVIGERLLSIRNWLLSVGDGWRTWWSNLVDGSIAPPSAATTLSHTEPLRSHLKRVSEALEKAEPYRKALVSMRQAFKDGKDATEIQKEVNRRNEIADTLAPLKALNALCEWVARTAIDGLSDRIGALLKDILVAEQLQYQRASLDRKEGLKVQGGFSSDLRIDATLVANTSWLRAVLWAFVFALREEAVAQFARDQLPLMMFDDPQATFDDYHRSRWANYIAKLQRAPSGIQTIIATYDIGFVDLIKMDGIVGREALLVAPGPHSDSVSVLEGAKIDRAWAKADAEKTPKAAEDYLADVREYAEGLLKLIVRGRDADVRIMALGDLRDLLERLRKSGLTPWDAPVIGSVISLIQKQMPETRYLEGSHHTTGRKFGMQEAIAVHKLWKKLGPAMEGAYRVIRDHRKLHGGMDLLFAAPASVDMPDGHQSAVSAIPLRVLGRAAALTDGRAADGTIDMSEFETKDQIRITLGKHSAFRLSARTLEPVARVGDIVLTKNYGEVSSRSLVAARFENRLLARRFEISDNVSDVVALTAQTLNPREIAPPIIVHRGSIDARKIVGVLFGHSKFPAAQSDQHEICNCGGQADLAYLARTALGLVEVEGKSAEPLALDKQYLIVQDFDPIPGCLENTGWKTRHSRRLGRYMLFQAPSFSRRREHSAGEPR